MSKIQNGKPISITSAGNFFEGLAPITHGSKRGYINKHGEFVVPMIYDEGGIPSEGLIAVRKGKSWGVVDFNNKTVVSFIYDKISNFSEGLCAVCKNDKWGFVDKSGNEVIPLTYDAVEDFAQGLCPVLKDNDKWGYIDRNEKTVIPFIYEFAEPIYGYFGKVGQNGLCGFINKKGELIIPCEYEEHLSYTYEEPYIGLTKDEEYWGIFDHEGDILVSGIKASMIEEFCDGIALIEHNDKMGAINPKGELIIPCEYDMLIDYSEGLIAAQKDGKYGFIDKDSNIVIPFMYKTARSFSCGLAYVETDKGCFYINKNNEVIISMQKSSIQNKMTGCIVAAIAIIAIAAYFLTQI